MTKPPPSHRVALPLAASALFALLTGCAPSEPPGTTMALRDSGTAIVDLNAPGPHQITVLVIKKDGASAVKPHRDKLTVQVEPELLDSSHYKVSHDRNQDKPADN